MSDDAIYQLGVEAHEQFVAESKAIDEAYRKGKLDEWLKEQLAKVNDGRSGQGDTERA